MASFAVCPHCYAQLAVPDGVSEGARVACPECEAKFDLAQTRRQRLAEVVLLDDSTQELATASAEDADDAVDDLADPIPPPSEGDDSQHPSNTAGAADDEFAEWFRNAQTVPEVGPEETSQVAQHVEIEEGPLDAPARKATAVTLADLQPPPVGPTFELPNVPLSPDNSATDQFDSDRSVYNSPAASTDFELEDVDFNHRAGNANAATLVSSTAGTSAAQDATTTPPTILPAPPRRRRRRSPLRTLLIAASAGPVGLVIGYFILIWLIGPAGDFLDVAQYVPQLLLPASFQSSTPILADADPLPRQSGPADGEPVREIDSANVPASFDQPAAVSDPLAENEDRDVEPQRFDEPSATPLVEDAPRVNRAPTYSADKLAAALDSAQAASSGLIDGDLATGDKSVRRSKGMSYAKLCDLARVLTFIDDSAAADRVAGLEQQADQLLGHILDDAHTRAEVAQIAAIWIESPNRQHGGVFLTGSIRGGQISGDLYEYELSTATGPDLMLVAAQPLDHLSDSPAGQGVVGAIIDDPTDRIPGYVGDARQVIWVGRVISLE